MTANFQGAGFALWRLLRVLGLVVLVGVVLLTCLPTTATAERVCGATTVQGTDTACVLLHTDFVQERVQANLPEPRDSNPADIARRIEAEMAGNGRGAFNITAIR